MRWAPFRAGVTRGEQEFSPSTSLRVTVAAYLLLVTGCRLRVAGCRLLVTCYLLQVAGCRLQVCHWSFVTGLEFRVVLLFIGY